MSKQGYLGTYEHMVKVRGLFPTAESAAEAAKHLDKTIGPTEPVSIYSIETGAWCPADVTRGDFVNYTMYRSLEDFKLQTNAFNEKMDAQATVTAMSSRPTEAPVAYDPSVQYCKKGPTVPGQNYVCVSIVAPSPDNAEGYRRLAIGNFMHSMLARRRAANGEDDEKSPEADLSPDDIYRAFAEKYGPFNAMENTVPLFQVHAAFPDPDQAGAFCKSVHGKDVFDMFITRTGFWTSLVQDSETTTYKEDYLNEFHKDRREMQASILENSAFIANDVDVSDADTLTRPRDKEDNVMPTAKKVHV
jgi:hypothetical protein